jgi:hypothetical protein
MAINDCPSSPFIFMKDPAVLFPSILIFAIPLSERKLIRALLFVPCDLTVSAEFPKGAVIESETLPFTSGITVAGD